MSKPPKKTSSTKASTRKGPDAPDDDADDSPYPGLNYYGNKAEDRDLFAGRAAEIVECGDMLFQSRVLILHGPTGCGKSSFLRAGIKPRIAKLDKHAKFAVDPGQDKGKVNDGKVTSDSFDVIRSSGRPLLAFIRRLRDIVEVVSKDTEEKVKAPRFGLIASPEALIAAKEAFSTPAKIAQMSRRGSLAYRGYRAVQRALQSPLILVIDQGEEVFTLNDERRLREEYNRLSANERGELEDLERERQGEISAYFEFLRFVAATGGGPLIVSLRTEYKGHFDDRIAGHEGHPGTWLKGFYLEPLGMEGIVEAIRRPALSEAEWKQRYTAGAIESAKRPERRLELIFSEARARQLAKELLDPDAIPPGGVLPALQVACRRLYEQAVAASGGDLKKINVTRSSIMRLGSVATQVEEYVSSKIEEACELKEVRDSPLTSGQLSALIHQGLAKKLVGVEADGRAVTRRLTEQEIEEDFSEHFGKKLPNHAVVREYLRGQNILRREAGAGEGKRQQIWWSLGHDSIALCLMKWRTVEGKDDPAMMRMAMMGASGNPSSWKLEDLYPKKELRNFSTPMRLAVARDFLWDRQLPFFAAEKHFDNRLGFAIEDINEIPSLDATAVGGGGPKDWLTLVKNVRDESKRRYDLNKTNADKTSMLVAAEWGAFPLIIRNEGEKSEVGTRRALAELEKHDLDPKDYARHWTDIATTNTNFGNGLIGPDIQGLATLREIEVATNGQDVGKIRDGMRAILRYLVTTQPEITNFDLRAKEMLLFATDLVFTAKEQDERDAIKAFLDTPVFRGESKYGIKDPIVELLLAQPDLAVTWTDREALVDADTAGKRPLKAGEQHFAVAGAFPRAMATQSGYKVYFGAKHVAWLARVEMEYRKTSEKIAGKKRQALTKYAPDVRDLAEATQRIISHTLWQFSLPNVRWDLGADRARVLRLASLAYYTSEYARSSMDETVAFLQRFAIGCLRKDPPGVNSLCGVRLNRTQVREAVGDCFNFVRFDEYASEVFDLDAPFAYWSEHSDYDSKSVAQAIYQELVALRQATLTHFDTVVGAISWLRYDGAYFPSNDDDVAEAFALKEFAWRHFRIMNFYDSERFMSKAASLLSERLETIARDKADLQSKRDEMEGQQVKPTQAE